MEQIFQDITSTQLFRILVFIFLKLAVFTVILRIVAAVIPQSSRVNCILVRMTGLFLGTLFAWWYSRNFMGLIQLPDEASRFLLFAIGLGINIVIIKMMSPMPQKADLEGGEKQNENKQPLPREEQE